MVRFEREGTNIASTIVEDVGYSPGTTIEIGLSTDAIEVISEESEDFNYDQNS
jgi:hypothetical protein